MISQQLAKLRAQHANACLRGDEQAARQLKRDMTALKLDEQIGRALSAIDPLTEEQRAQLGRHFVGVKR